MQVISLRDALQKTEEKTRNEKALPFDISFYTADFTLKKLKNCVRCAVKGNQKKNKIIGVRSLEGGHPYPVFIYWIEEFNGQKVFWG